MYKQIIVLNLYLFFLHDSLVFNNITFLFFLYNNLCSYNKLYNTIKSVKITLNITVTT